MISKGHLEEAGCCFCLKKSIMGSEFLTPTGYTASMDIFQRDLVSHHSLIPWTCSKIRSRPRLSVCSTVKMSSNSALCQQLTKVNNDPPTQPKHFRTWRYLTCLTYKIRSLICEFSLEFLSKTHQQLVLNVHLRISRVSKMLTDLLAQRVVPNRTEYHHWSKYNSV